MNVSIHGCICVFIYVYIYCKQYIPEKASFSNPKVTHYRPQCTTKKGLFWGMCLLQPSFLYLNILQPCFLFQVCLNAAQSWNRIWSQIQQFYLVLICIALSVKTISGLNNNFRFLCRWFKNLTETMSFLVIKLKIIVLYYTYYFPLQRTNVFRLPFKLLKTYKLLKK